jgi:SAM-dependent methyltransferase
VRGRVLDVGCGGGRACLHLQGRGLAVVGIDTSAGAVACCAQRGVRDVRRIALEYVPDSLGRFDTIMLLGQNFGMMGSPPRARRLLRRLASLTTARGRIVAETFDPHAPDDPADRRYVERNLARGRMAGQLRVRTRYRDLATPWTDWLQLSPDELAGLVDGTGWRLHRTLHHRRSYVAVLDKR